LAARRGREGGSSAQGKGKGEEGEKRGGDAEERGDKLSLPPQVQLGAAKWASIDLAIEVQLNLGAASAPHG